MGYYLKQRRRPVKGQGTPPCIVETQGKIGKETLNRMRLIISKQFLKTKGKRQSETALSNVIQKAIIVIVHIKIAVAHGG